MESILDLLRFIKPQNNGGKEILGGFKIFRYLPTFKIDNKVSDKHMLIHRKVTRHFKLFRQTEFFN